MLRIAKTANEIAAAREGMIARLTDGAEVIKDISIPTKGGPLNKGDVYRRDGLWGLFGYKASPRTGNNILWEISFGTATFLDGPSIEFNLPQDGHRNIGLSAGRVVVTVAFYDVPAGATSVAR
jgi:hypothetical protein